ncbi:MAG: hypothetical protein LKI25_05805 [Atopobiaceae bacterium]|jgi:hypothetical protein|nr:hypothetical protein [Atopobiaceae bacterium]MCI2173712.1 hypothetical protein [Atopobiaceae bacterium]MCI2207646.1 hypothetical protein [Atopobiaceae bacterium]
MGEGLWGAESARAVCHTEEDDSRDVLVWEGDGGRVFVCEAMEGEVTRQVFDVDRHVHRVDVAPGERDALTRVLGLDTVERGLDAFFRDGETFLSDLMDLMDVAGVAYGYVSRCGDGPVSWRPARSGERAWT